ncbi:MAG TPA: hypothetical protein VJ865_04265 [Gemmatimonadaceae bacterium]|nr:hypothetical protein [Gemmatimonadaceae bacterium]
MSETDDSYAVLEGSNRAYGESYQRNAILMSMLDEVAQFDPEFRKCRTRPADAFVRRTGSGIADLQGRGLADRHLDSVLVRWALSVMVSRDAHSVFAFGESDEMDSEPSDFETLAASPTRSGRTRRGYRCTSPRIDVTNLGWSHD